MAPVNSSYDDFSLVTENGRKSYFASNRGNRGDDQLYYAEYYFIPPPNTIRVTVHDSLSFETIVDPEIQVLDTTTLDNIVAMEVEGDSLFGYVLDSTKFYKVIVNHEGYFTKEDYWYSGDASGSTMEWEVLLTPIIPEEPIELKNIYYDFDKATLRDSLMLELNRVIIWLEENPEIRIEIGAHTDNIGEADYNLDLSRRRAQSVVDYLVESGIDPSRLEAKGYGEFVPKVECPDPQDCTAADHQKNRRTEMKVIKISPRPEESSSLE